MDTIVRDTNGKIKELATVVKTIKYLVNTQPGFYRIGDIQKTINAQVEPLERFTYRMVRNNVVILFEKWNA